MMLKAKEVESGVIRESGGDFSISEVLRELEAGDGRCRRKPGI